MHRRKLCRIALAGVTAALFGGCGSGGKGGSGDNGTSAAFVRLDLGRAPDYYSRVRMNASGQVAMTRAVERRYAFPQNYNGSTHHACLWTGSGWENLQPGVGTASVVVDINDQGQVLLYALDEPIQYSQSPRVTGVFLYSQGAFTEIRPPEPHAENLSPARLGEDGSVLGSYTVPTDATHSETRGFLWRNGQIVPIPGFDPVDINRSGQILLVTPYHIRPSQWAVRQPDGTITRGQDLLPGGETFTPVALLDDGGLAGGWQATSQVSRPAILRAGVITPVLATEESGTIDSVNGRGDILGHTGAGPFLRRSDGVLVNITPYLPLKYDWEYYIDRRFQELNDRGQVVGTYGNGNGLHTCFLLTPPSLAPKTGIASVKISDVRNKKVDPRPFVATSVAGDLLTPHFLEVLVSTRTTTEGQRNFLVTLNLDEAIEVGKSYPLSERDMSYLTGLHTGVSYTQFQANIRTGYNVGRGNIIVDKMTDAEITFRLDKVLMGNNWDDGTWDGPSFTLDATITIKR